MDEGQLLYLLYWFRYSEFPREFYLRTFIFHFGIILYIMIKWSPKHVQSLIEILGLQTETTKVALT